jgi:hypothetical protein
MPFARLRSPRGFRLSPWPVATVAAAALGVWLGGRESAAQRPAHAPLDAGPGGLWISASPLDDGRQLLIVIDPHLKNAAVYNVDAAGTLALKSTRDITWDLMVGDFNAQAPRPADLRKMLEAGQGAAGAAPRR